MKLNNLSKKIKIKQLFKAKSGKSITRSEPPSHYELKVENFSFLKNIPLEKWESGVFEAEGYHWKLLLYPQGNLRDRGEKHVSLYLELVDMGDLPQPFDVRAAFRFFVYCEPDNEYEILYDTRGKFERYHNMKTVWGFSRLMSLDEISRRRSTFVTDDTCTFGVEIFVSKKTVKSDVLSMIKSGVPTTNTWELNKFLRLPDFVQSIPYHDKDLTWRVHLYPHGRTEANETFISLFLNLDNSVILGDVRVLVKFTVRIADQLQKGNDIKRTGYYWFTAEDNENGWLDFAERVLVEEIGRGYVVHGWCQIEFEISRQGSLVSKIVPDEILRIGYKNESPRKLTNF